MKRVYVIDTSYLMEIYRVPGGSDARSGRVVKRRFGEAIRGQARLFVPVGCVFELCNHVAGVRDGRSRRELAAKIAADVTTAIGQSVPWSITPAGSHDDLLRQVSRFADTYASQGVGLTDTQVAETAARLKDRFADGLGYAVHIWTRDARLKALEPDPERSPFV